MLTLLSSVRHVVPMKTHSSELNPRGAFKMKALTLAAVIALSATGAAPLVLRLKVEEFLFSRL
jgi:hypothetical protein